MNLRNVSGLLGAGFLCLASSSFLSSSGCSSSPGGTGGTGASGGSAGTGGSAGSSGAGGSSGSGACGAALADDDYAGCATCKWSSSASPGQSMCTSERSVNACCDWVEEPASSTALQRAFGLHDYSTTGSSPVDYGCLTTPPTAGAVHTATLTGYVKIFSSGSDTAGVKVQVFKVDTSTGALGSLVGSDTTTMTSKSEMNTWLNACTTNPCLFRQYSISGVPTETPLVIETSDGGGMVWSTLYDYNIYFSDSASCSGTPPGAPCVSSSSGSTWALSYDVTAVAPADIQTAASTVGQVTNSAQGVLAGEVHDCGDIRISGANVDTDQAHQGPIFYFNDIESNPLPDSSRQMANEGTSTLGLFGALNMNTGTPIRVSAVGNYNGKDTLLGTAVVQVFSGPSVTAVTLRGRRSDQ